MYMINNQAFNFLKNLKNNNNKEWFHAHRKEYDIARSNFTSVMKDIAIKISEFDDSISPDTDVYQFRINRDIRFSKDKSPYKTNFAGFISPGGKNGAKAGYYLSIEPGNNFLGGGVWMPPKDQLDQIRGYIVNHEDEFRDIIYAESVRDLFGGFDSNEQLKTVPRGYDKDHPAAELLKYKSFTLGTKITQSVLSSKDFVDKSMEYYKEIYTLVAFLNRAVK